jgi:hypothetical protein
VIRFKLRGLKEAMKQLKKFERSIPFAMREGLTNIAWSGRSIWTKEVEKSFTLRNTFTTRSLQVDRATGREVKGMRAVLGSRAPYMGRAEVGGTVRGKSASKPIPTAVAAGQSMGARRTRLVRASAKLGRIKAAKAMRAATQKQRNAVALRMAAKSGNKHVLLERKSGGKALFQLKGGKRNRSVKMLWDLSRSSVQVPPTPTLERTLQQLKRRAPLLMAKAFRKQLVRNRLFGFG